MTKKHGKLHCGSEYMTQIMKMIKIRLLSLGSYVVNKDKAVFSSTRKRELLMTFHCSFRDNAGGHFLQHD